MLLSRSIRPSLRRQLGQNPVIAGGWDRGFCTAEGKKAEGGKDNEDRHAWRQDPNRASNRRGAPQRRQHRPKFGPSMHNAPVLLHPDVKNNIYQLWQSDSGQWDAPALATKFKMRQARIEAIIKVKELEAEHRAAGRYNEELEKLLVDLYCKKKGDIVGEPELGEVETPPTFAFLHEDEDEDAFREEIKRKKELKEAAKAKAAAQLESEDYASVVQANDRTKLGFKDISS